MSVWVALSRPDDVTLHVQGQPDVTVTPVQVGVHLWLAVLTSMGDFTAGSIFPYSLSSPGWTATPNWADFGIGAPLPSFPGLPTALTDLAVLHTSCRKFHGNARDGLTLAPDLIAASPRPNLLLLTGDQIYADDVPAVLAPRIRRIAADLVGRDESAVFGPLPKIGGRQAPGEAFGLTSSDASDHLWAFGEYLAVHLLAWSDVLWPAALPPWSAVDPAVDLDPALGMTEADWNVLSSKVTTFRQGLPAVRRTLANVPTLMVLDDHEVTDDWNLNFRWAAKVYADPRGRRLVANALLAYNLCQHWGNVPDRFAAAGTPEAQVLADLQPDLARLGVPVGPPAAPPSALRDPSPTSIRYDMTLGPAEGLPIRLTLLDERTMREFPDDRGPAARISHTALAAMLPSGTPGPTIVVAPSPAFGTHVVEHVIQPAANLFPGGAVFADYESWPGVTANYADFLARLAALGPVVALSGDVHYGAAAGFDYDAARAGAGLTCSGAKNADSMTLALHLAGDFAMKVGLERARSFSGFRDLTPAQRASLAAPPAAGTSLPYDDVADIAVGRVLRAGQESPAVLAAQVATAYGLGPADFRYTITPVDDERMPDSGPLLTDMLAAPAPWTGWDPAKSVQMLHALRAGDLHRIGHMFSGLPQVALVWFTGGPLTVHQRLYGAAGETGTAQQVTEVMVRLA
ncbi:hypothetical protein [Nonomuraea sediminis]|uniref:hypothetical protein n=1 Tax=Nonomuraea sediminis TaxID=2835864 RepID=UPI001BDD4E22|nr:hypothetical protein [Nonomuraea sediminis]